MKTFRLEYVLAALLLLLALLAPPAHAGITQSQIPTWGKVDFVILPDGTFLPLKGDANGNAGAPWTPMGFQKLTVSSTAVALTVPADSTWCIVKVETDAVRWRDDGTNPVAATGMPQAVGDTFVYSGTLSAIKFIRVTTDATLSVSYYK